MNKSLGRNVGRSELLEIAYELRVADTARRTDVVRDEF